MRGEQGTSRAIVVRPSLEAERAHGLLEHVAVVPWPELYHAYGPAIDVPGQLAAVIVGDDETRDEAWWNLWGNIHHQGTIYEATVPGVPLLLGLADWVSGSADSPEDADAVFALEDWVRGGSES